MNKTTQSVKSPFCRAWAVIGALALIFVAHTAFAQSVGVHFVSAGGPSVENGSPDSLPPTDSAGVPVYAQTNWNNLGANGDSYGNWEWATWINNGSGPGAPVVLTDSTGAATSLQITWGSTGFGSTGAAASLGTPDGDLMDGFINTYANGSTPAFLTNSGPAYFAPSPDQLPCASISGLQSWLAGIPGAIGYKVVLYFSESPETYNPKVEGYVNATTGSVLDNTMAEVATLTPPVYGQAASTFTGTYVLASSTDPSSPSIGANYMVFNGLTNDSIVIHAVMTGWLGAVNGFQIIPFFASAQTTSVGVHFVSAGGPSVENGSPDSLPPTASAGAAPYAQTNWNNLGSQGDSYGNWEWATWIDGGPGAPVVLTDSTGAATALQITWGSGLTGFGSTGAATNLDTPDGDLMDGYLTCYANGSPTDLLVSNGPVYLYTPSADQLPCASISGLQSWLAGTPGATSYNVVIYFSAAVLGPTVEGYVNSATGSVVNSTLTEVGPLTPPVYGQSGIFAGTYVQATSTAPGSPTVGANYMVLTGLTNDTIVIHEAMQGWQGAWNGFQIVPVIGSAPTVSSDASLSQLALSPLGALSPAFDPGTTNYTATEAFVDTPVTVTVTNTSEFATNELFLNGVEQGSPAVGSLTASVPLGLGSTNVIQVQVTAQDGVTVSNYFVSVTLQPSLTVPKLTSSVSGSTLTLSWPADHLGYRLLMQTNNLSKGVSANIADWGMVPGSDSITTTNIAVIKTGVTNAYYRLVYP